MIFSRMSTIRVFECYHYDNSYCSQQFKVNESQKPSRENAVLHLAMRSSCMQREAWNGKLQISGEVRYEIFIINRLDLSGHQLFHCALHSIIVNNIYQNCVLY
jgi:hypothetical protein